MCMYNKGIIKEQVMTVHSSICKHSRKNVLIELKCRIENLQKLLLFAALVSLSVFLFL